MSFFRSSFRGRQPSLVGVAALALLLWLVSAASGDNSVMAPLAKSSLLLDAAAAGQRLVAVGERGHVLISGDQGRSWQQRQTPTRATLTSVFFIDDRLGWAAGHDQVILRTSDGGTNWQRVHQDIEDGRPVLDLVFLDPQHGLAVGGYGLYLETLDGGSTWESLSFPVVAGTATQGPYDLDEEDGAGLDYHLNHLSQGEGGRLYIAAEAGHLYRSDDRGGSWQALPSPYQGSFFATLPLNGETLLACGLRGHAFRSDDGGMSWEKIATGTFSTLNDAVRLADGRLALLGLAGATLLSDDGGRTVRPVPRSDRAGISRVLEAADGALVLFGEGGAHRLILGKSGGQEAKP